MVRLLTKLNNSTLRGRGAIEIFNFVFFTDNFSSMDLTYTRFKRAGCFNIIPISLVT